MKIYQEISLENFEAWSGGLDTLNRVINEDKVDILESVLDDLYPDGLDETALNDILWFDDEWVFEVCGIRTESEIQEELNEVQSEMEELIETFLEESEELEPDEKDALWTNDYAFDYEQMEEKVKELEEELDNI